jgi:hypothetical protein
VGPAPSRFYTLQGLFIGKIGTGCAFRDLVIGYRYMAHRRFIVFLNARGYWVAREKLGFIEGVFPTQREALRFALVSAKRGRGSRALGPGGGEETRAAACVG